MPCNNCGPIQDRVAQLKQVSTAVTHAHEMLAKLYESIAEDFEAEEKEQFLSAAKVQRRLAEESAQIVVPDFAGE